MKINLLCVFCCPESLFFFPPPSNFQNSPRLGDRRACHIVYRVDRFDYLGECDRFLGVIIISWYEERVSFCSGYSFLYWRYLKL